MAKLRKTFIQGKMNKDIDERLLPSGHYRHAENVRVVNTYGEDSSAVKDIKGTTPQTSLPNATTLGSISDASDRTIYFATVNDSGYSYIYEYNQATKTTTRVLGDKRQYQVLGFNRSSRVFFAILNDPINKTKYLAFTDNLNPPRLINVARAKDFDVDSFDEEDISLYKKPPLFPPDANLVLSGAQENNIEERFFAFAYRYRYQDGFYSALSTFSEYKFAPKRFDLDHHSMENRGMVNAFNAVDIKYNTGDSRVEAVEIVFKNPNSNTVYIAETVDKDKLDYENDVEKTYRFTNNSLYKALPDDEYKRLFDNVPNKAQSVCFIGNRLVLANYTEGFTLLLTEGDDTSELNINYAVNYYSKENKGDTLLTTYSSDNSQVVINFSVSLKEDSSIDINIFLSSEENNEGYYGGPIAEKCFILDKTILTLTN